MPFNSKLIQPDPAPLDSRGEIQLPDDLLALAEQLTADSQHLADRFSGRPIAAVVPSAQHARNRSRFASARHAIARGLVAIAMSSAFLLLMAKPSGHPEARPTPDRELKPVASQWSADSARDISFAPAALDDVSRPELEGLIDLWQQQSNEVASVSF